MTRWRVAWRGLRKRDGWGGRQRRHHDGAVSARWTRSPYLCRPTSDDRIGLPIRGASNRRVRRTAWGRREARRPRAASRGCYSRRQALPPDDHTAGGPSRWPLTSPKTNNNKTLPQAAACQHAGARTTCWRRLGNRGTGGESPSGCRIRPTAPSAARARCSTLAVLPSG